MFCYYRTLAGTLNYAKKALTLPKKIKPDLTKKAQRNNSTPMAILMAIPMAKKRPTEVVSIKCSADNYEQVQKQKLKCTEMVRRKI